MSALQLFFLLFLIVVVLLLFLALLWMSLPSAVLEKFEKALFPKGSARDEEPEKK